MKWRIQTEMNYREIITMEPKKMGGKPCIRGLHITVYDVLDYLAADMSEAEILADFPDLTHEVCAHASPLRLTGSGVFSRCLCEASDGRESLTNV